MLIREIIEGNTFVNEAVSGVFSVKESPILVDGWEDITSMENWDLYGERILDYLQVRIRIQTILMTKMYGSFTNWGTLSNSEKNVAVKWILVPYSLRITVVNDATDKINWDRLVELSMGDGKIINLTGRALMIEKMRRYVSEQLRIEVLAKNDIDDFYFTIESMVNAFVKTNSNYFKNWINNTVGTTYENNGFKQKSYYSDEKRDYINNILNGN